MIDHTREIQIVYIKIGDYDEIYCSRLVLVLYHSVMTWFLRSSNLSKELTAALVLGSTGKAIDLTGANWFNGEIWLV